MSHPHDLPTHDDHTGYRRVLGLKPPKPNFHLAAPTDYPVIPRDQWVEFEEDEPFGIGDQDGKGACQAFSDAEAVRYAYDLQGVTVPPLSAWYAYGKLTGGRDVGSSIAEGLDLITANGLPPDSLVKYGDYSGRYSPEVEAATAYRCEIGAMLTTFDQIVSAVLRREPVVFSLCVGAAWDQFDADGCVRACRGPGNHAITTGRALKRARDGRWLPRFRNHWTLKWGFGGYAWFDEACWRNQMWAEAFVVRAPRALAADNPPAAA